jgi:hypothetical protein
MKNSRRIFLLVILGFINLFPLLSQTPPPPYPPGALPGSPIEGGLIYLIISVVVYSIINIGYIKKSIFRAKKLN